MNISSIPFTTRPSSTRPSIRYEKPGRTKSVIVNVAQSNDGNESWSQTSPQKSPVKSAKKKSTHVKYHGELSVLHKQHEGLHLDFEAREQVIRDLKDLDCFSDDGNTEPEQISCLPGDLSFSNRKALALEIRQKKRALENFVHRVEDIRERMPTASELEAHNNRIQTRERNINRAVDVFVQRRQAKNEKHNQQMIAFLKEAASAENQQIRRFAIGFISRLVNKAKADYLLR
jgi:hypothetical protein